MNFVKHFLRPFIKLSSEPFFTRFCSLKGISYIIIAFDLKVRNYREMYSFLSCLKSDQFSFTKCRNFYHTLLISFQYLYITSIEFLRVCLQKNSFAKAEEVLSFQIYF